MKQRSKTWLVFVIVIAVLGFLGYQKSQLNGGSAVDDGKKPSSGAAKNLKKAPEWELRQLSGTKYKSADLNGKVVLVTFWTTWCPSCKKEIAILTELQNEYADKNLQIIGISLDRSKPGKVGAFAEGMGIKYPVLIGTANVVKAFGDFSVIPSTFIIDSEGNIVKYLRGAAPKNQLTALIDPLLK